MPLNEETIQRLRTEAEEIVRTQKSAIQDSADDELVHELNVQKIELELQNQQLRETEMKLQEAIDLYQQLYNRSPIGHLSLDLKGNIVQLNETFASFCQMPASDLRFHYFAELLGEESSAIFRHRFAAFFKQPEGKILNVWLQGKRSEPVYLKIFGEKETYGNLIACNLVDSTKEKLAEQQELAIKERFTQLFEHMSSGVAVYYAIDEGNDFVFVDFNKAAERIENVDRYSVIGRKVTEIFPGIKNFGLLNIFQRVWKTGIPEEHPVTEYTDDRLNGWRENYIYKLPTGEIVSIFDDVTQQKKTEMALAQSEERLSIATSGTQDGLWDLNLETGEAYMSDRYFVMLGYQPGELPGSREAWSDLLHPYDKADAEERLTAYLNGKTDIYTSTFRMRSKDGSYRWINGRGQATWDANGKPVRITGFNTDITRLVETQAELTKANEIINRGPATAFSWQNRPGWPVNFVSDNVQRLLGYSAQDFLSGKLSYASLIHPEDMHQVEKEVISHSADRETFQFSHQPYRLLKKDGQTIWVTDHTYILRNSAGEPEYFEGVIYDITEQKKAEDEIKELRGILPICMYCKEIRDEEGYWQQLEKYITENSAAEFSHGICEKCMQEKFPKVHEKKRREQQK